MWVPCLVSIPGLNITLRSVLFLPFPGLTPVIPSSSALPGKDS